VAKTWADAYLEIAASQRRDALKVAM
jgi:hypothetical protein